MNLKPKIPNFEIGEICGRGASSVVWIGVDADGIKRAIRTIDITALPAEQIKHETEAISLFRNVSVQHENILDILYFGKTSKFLYYVTALADNISEYSQRYAPDTLAHRIRDTRYSDKEIREFMLALLRGVEYLHAKNIAHRDLKPENILFVGHELKIADPGLTSPGEKVSMSGTNGYLPPWKNATGVEADLYAIGKILYCLYSGNDATQFPELPEQLRSAIPSKLNDIALRCCSTEPEERYRTASEIRASLDAAYSIKERFPHLRRNTIWILSIALTVSLWFNFAHLIPESRYHMPIAEAEEVFTKLRNDFGLTEVKEVFESLARLEKTCPELARREDFQKFRKLVQDNFEWLTFQAVPDHVIQSFPITTNLVIPVSVKEQMGGFDRYFSLSKNKTLYASMLFEYYVFLKRTGRETEAREMRNLLAKISPMNCNSVALAFTCMKMSNVQAHEKKYDEALFFAEKARDASPNIHVAYILLFQANYLLGHREEAENNLREILRLKPDSVFVPHFYSLLTSSDLPQEKIQTRTNDFLRHDLSMFDCPSLDSYLKEQKERRAQKKTTATASQPPETSASPETNSEATAISEKEKRPTP